MLIEHRHFLIGLLFMVAGAGIAPAQPMYFPSYRVEQGETRYLSGNYVFSNMVVNGTLILTGDTQITLEGPTIEEEGISPGFVFYLKYTGKIENEVHHGVAGTRGMHGWETPYDPSHNATNGRDSNPDDPDDPPGNGTDGKRGYDGGDGLPGGDGWSAPTLIIRAKGGGAWISGQIEFTGGTGAMGGYGGDATDGGGGGHGGYSKYLPDGRGGNGSTGGNAGHGGKGGKGGDGGTFKLTANWMVFLLGDITLNGGNGGGGGAAGEAGNGGMGGWGGYFTIRDGNDHGDGIAGSGGNAAYGGNPGEGGTGGDGGIIDIYATDDIWYTGKPRRLSASGGRGGARGGNGAGGGSGGSGGHIQTPSGENLVGAPFGVGIHLPDVFGSVGQAGDGGAIKLVTRGSLKPYYDDQQYWLRLDAYGGQGGRPTWMDETSVTADPSSPNSYISIEPYDALIPGGRGGEGGKAIIMAKGTARARFVLQGGPGNFGQDGQFSRQLGMASDGAPGGDGGPGGKVEVIAPAIYIYRSRNRNRRDGRPRQPGRLPWRLGGFRQCHLRRVGA